MFFFLQLFSDLGTWDLGLCSALTTQISPRDFVSVRQWLKRDGNMVISETSVEHPDRPATDEHIRGLMGPGGESGISLPFPEPANASAMY